MFFLLLPQFCTYLSLQTHCFCWQRRKNISCLLAHRYGAAKTNFIKLFYIILVTFYVESLKMFVFQN